MDDYSFLSPQQANAGSLVGPDIGMQDDNIQHQLALAQQLRAQPQAHTTGMGGMLGALAGGINTFSANSQENLAAALRKKMQTQDEGQRRSALDQRQKERMENMEFIKQLELMKQQGAQQQGQPTSNPTAYSGPMEQLGQYGM